MAARARLAGFGDEEVEEDAQFDGEMQSKERRVDTLLEEMLDADGDVMRF